MIKSFIIFFFAFIVGYAFKAVTEHAGHTAGTIHLDLDNDDLPVLLEMSMKPEEIKQKKWIILKVNPDTDLSQKKHTPL